jgi:peptidoglycan/LPS O-acetylase OafA/YrhL
VTAVIAVAAAAASYYVLERPLLRLKYRRTPAR